MDIRPIRLIMIALLVLGPTGVLYPGEAHAKDYFVNDGDTEGDVYTRAPGSYENDGLTPESPMAGITDVLDEYEVGPDDRILVDTGTYPIGSEDRRIHLEPEHSGSPDLPLRIVGSTVHQGTVLTSDAKDPPDVFFLEGRSRTTPIAWIHLEKLVFRTHSWGISFTRAKNITIRECVFDGQRTAPGKNRKTIQGFGIYGDLWGPGSGNWEIESCVFKNIGFGGLAFWGVPNVTISNCTFYAVGGRGSFKGTKSAAVLLKGMSPKGTISNSIFSLTKTNSVGITIDRLAQQGFSSSDNFFHKPGLRAAFGDYGGMKATSMLSWVALSSQDLKSKVGDPDFVDPTKSDLHLLSAFGYYTNDRTWKRSDVTSDCIREGKPNLGAYGITAFASKATLPEGSEALPITQPDDFPPDVSDPGESGSGTIEPDPEPSDPEPTPEEEEEDLELLG